MKLALLDIDGVLANDGHRIDHALNKRWSQYFDPKLVGRDALWEEGKALADSLIEDGWVVGYLTGRRTILRVVTEQWLDAHEFPIGRLIMREQAWYNEKVKVPLADFKVEIIKDLLTRADVEDIVLYDDDPSVVSAIKDAVGSQHAILCTWNIKPQALITKATA